ALAERVSRPRLYAPPFRDLLPVERQQRGDVRAAVAEHDRLRDVSRRLEVVLEVLRGDVLAAGCDEDVLLAVGDRDEPVLVDLGDVAGTEPAVLAEHLAGRL